MGAGIGNFRWMTTFDIEHGGISMAAHNAYLLALAEGGLVLLGAYLLLFGVTLRDLWRARAQSARLPEVGLQWLILATRTNLFAAAGLLALRRGVEGVLLSADPRHGGRHCRALRSRGERPDSRPDMTPTAIAYVIPRMAIGGAQTHLIHVLRHLDRRRFTPVLCCLATDRNDPIQLLDQVRELGVPILDGRVQDTANALGRPHALLQMARIARELRRRRVQIVHSYLFHANWFGTLTARMARVPVAIVSKRSMDVYPRARDRWACRLVNRLADRVTAVAEAVRDHVHLTEGCPLDKIVVIPNGIDTAGVPAPPGSPGLPPDLGAEGEPGKVVGTITRLVWKRGHEELLAAAAIIARAEPGAKLLIVGDGPLRASLEDRARQLGLNGEVRFLGAVAHAARLLPSFDVFVLSSLLEGMSNALLEAMAAGRPVVATRVGGNSELVVDGETGFLVPPRDPEALANAVIRLVRDPRAARRFGEAGRRRAESEFSLTTMVGRLERLYESLLADRPRAA